MKPIIVLALVFAQLTGWTSESCMECRSLDNFFSKADLFLRTHVANGLVDYNAIKANRTTLDELTRMMSTASLSGESESAVKAFWINAYNITMIKSVVDNLPISKPTDVPGLFDAKLHAVAHQNLTLNDIENKKLREVYHDARVHFVLVCGAKGCPVLITGAYMPTTLEIQILTQTKIALNNPNFTQVNERTRTVRLSQIFQWYATDFTTGGKTLIEYVNGFRNTPIPSDYNVEYYEYDWSLNIKK